MFRNSVKRDLETQHPSESKDNAEGDWKGVVPGSIGRILHAQSLNAHFQPIVSLRQKSVIGVEALARAYHPDTGLAVPPQQLFEWAAQWELTHEIDELCRNQAMRAYRSMPSDVFPLLFVNYEASLLNGGNARSGSFTQSVQDAGLEPSNVVIEINESKVENHDRLKDFVDEHRSRGFLIALDDLGAGFSNLQRLSLLKPEILKLDRSLIMGLDQDSHKRELFRSLVMLGRGLGSLVVAEGVETEGEMAVCTELGADLIQGYYFSRPTAPHNMGAEHLELRLTLNSVKQRTRAMGKLEERRRLSRENMKLLDDVAMEISRVPKSGFDAALQGLVSRASTIECLYVVDKTGAQVSATVESEAMSRRPRSRLFQPAPLGSDHSLKEYFYSLIDGGLPSFTTAPYLSLASGRLCRTISRQFGGRGGRSYVLCMDLEAYNPD